MGHDPRDLEWQRRYEEKDTPWDKGAPAPALVEFLKTGAIRGRVLVPGCGLGHDVRALGTVPGIQAVGLDLSPTAIERAKEIGGLADPARIRFVTGDFFHLLSDFTSSFDWMVEHTCFCAIDPQMRQAYVQAAASALRPGGRIFGIFYLNPDTETGPPFAVSEQDLTTLLGSQFNLLDKWVPEQSFPGREGRELVWIMERKSG